MITNIDIPNEVSNLERSESCLVKSMKAYIINTFSEKNMYALTITYPKGYKIKLDNKSKIHVHNDSITDFQSVKYHTSKQIIEKLSDDYKFLFVSEKTP